MMGLPASPRLGYSLSCPPATLYLGGGLTLTHLRSQVTCHLKADPGTLHSHQLEAAWSPPTPPPSKPGSFRGG